MFILTLVSISILSYVCEASAEGVGQEWLLSRHRREVRCANKYGEITTGHTACLPRSSMLRTSGLEPGEQESIIATHNTARRGVNPPASNMQMMSWDESLANIAQRWAENCAANNHDNDYKRTDFGRLSVGQNLAWGSYKLGWSKAISLWENEKKDYTFGGANSGKVVGHYTQMVWANSSKVGCGYADCNSQHYYVCNYGPGGNFHNQLPYALGTTCSACSNRCTNGLCDCGRLVCLNGGTLDLKQCKCTCLKPFHTQPNCALNCTGAQDNNYCQRGWSGKCEVYSNIPYECPNMCKWCPFADAKFDNNAKFYNDGNRSASSPNMITTLVIAMVVCAFD
ncbi:cysteine-rich venom protein kaouthin-2-like isoform X2 [Dreissena polymorpha]|uniref:SCP domain-containing protein n=1 Tax=Dreissena polymorpha TaxID=45954 RepID=A0A9D4RLL2_DREPO|nr:cysteine-rich venom protein kaouthin-2-like isoform X2 [Dreissena polymorpha]KAH3870735.1 hypothetical protein DPMN_033927 [Dreissena polymorpha]